MPIKGLTDQPRSFYEIGQLRKGAPKPENSNRPGEDLTYFRATFNEEEDKAAAMFYQAYGDEPKEINAFLPFNEVDENFEAWREAYVAGGLVHRCDGETVQYEIDPTSGEVVVMDGLHDQTGEPVKCDGSAGCKPRGRLKVIVPELRRLAFMVALTTSVWDIANISRQLEGIKFANGGKLQLVPLILKRRPKRISTPGGKNGKRARYEKWLLSIEPHPDWVESKILALPEAEEERPLELPPGVPDTNGDAEEVAYDIPGDVRVWEDERPEWEAGEVPFDEAPPDPTMPDSVHNMNDFYRVAQERFGYPNKKTITAALSKVLGSTVYEAQKNGTTMEDLWAILVDIAMVSQMALEG